jgi:Flp pilus assembly protein TadD
MGTDQSAVKEPAGAKANRNPLIRGWEIQINTWPRKIIAITLVLATCGALIYRISGPLRAAWITRSGRTDPAIYERAIKYDPENASYHFTLAEIYNNSTEHLDLKRAGEEYEAAVRLNPRRWLYWIGLSTYYEQTGNEERCRYAMKMALERDPNYAQTRWAAANLYIRLNDLKAADFELRRTADLDVSYVTQVLDLVWRFYEDPERIMSTHVPNTKDANLAAMNYFVSQKSERGAELAWEKLKTFDTKPPDRFAYIEYLIELGKPHQASEIFSFPARPGMTDFFNGSFEADPLRGGFDWRFASWEHADARRDTTTAKDGFASFLVTFSGKENLDYYHLWHYLPVQKGGSYNLQFWMKTEAISTNEGVFVEVDGQRSEPQVGNTYWKQFTIPFTASEDMVRAHLRRVPTKKFDNLLSGKVWLDAFTLTAVP